MALATDAIEKGRIDPSRLFYINVDDSRNGLAQKARITSDFGINMLSQGYNGFKVGHLVPALETMIEDGSAAGSFVIIDTMKKFVDLMRKREASVFAEVARRFVLKGGTILCFAHVNKHRSGNGKVIYAGTSDIIDDFDCAYSIDIVEDEADKRIVEFECLKSRGGGTQQTAYSYSTEPDLDYLTRMLSVTEVDRSKFAASIKPEPQVKDDDIVEALRLSIIHQKPPTKMAIIPNCSERYSPQPENGAERP